MIFRTACVLFPPLRTLKQVAMNEENAFSLSLKIVFSDVSEGGIISDTPAISLFLKLGIVLCKFISILSEILNDS